MIKRIPADRLKIGMFIHDFNCSWVDHPFLRNSLKVEDQKTIDKIVAAGIRELFIDTAKGLDVAGAQTEEEFNSELHDQFSQFVRMQGERDHPRVPLKSEIVVARTVHREAHRIVNNVLQDVRNGKPIEVAKVEPVVGQLADSVFRNRDALISLSRIKRKDDYTFQHSVSVSVLLISFCLAMEYERRVIVEIGMGGLLHDIGKMMVPDHILNKPGALTAAEFALMQSHAPVGREILKSTPGMPETALMIAGEHHERYDGTGYPDKLKEQEISQFGQMASIVDVYDALSSNRVYHKAIEPTAALKKLFEWRTSHFNEALVQHFIRAIGIYPVGSLVRLKSGLLGVVIDPDNEDLLHPTVRAVYDLKRRNSIAPRDIDLSRDPAEIGGDGVVGHESPEQWGIDPYRYL